MAAKDQDHITLHLEGARAAAGVALSDFEDFIEGFLGALRNYERSRRGALAKKSGRPEAAASAAAAFRLVAFREGSGIATIVPDVAAAEEFDTEPMFDGEPRQMTNLRALVEAVKQGAPLPEPVIESLEKARRTFGPDGSIRVDLPSVTNRPASVTIDATRIEAIRAAAQQEPAVEVDSVSGRLHEIDVEPDELAIRLQMASIGLADTPEHLEPLVENMVNKLVWARGSGSRQSLKRGTMEIEAIELIDQGEQTASPTRPCPRICWPSSKASRSPRASFGSPALGWTPMRMPPFSLR